MPAVGCVIAASLAVLSANVGSEIGPELITPAVPTYMPNGRMFAFPIYRVLLTSGITSDAIRSCPAPFAPSIRSPLVL